MKKPFKLLASLLLVLYATTMPDAPEPTASNPIWWFLALMLGLFIIWMFTGGPQRYEEQHKLTPPTTQTE
ncbi:MAG: hypothetical protein COV10_04035 [Candidatus Vogelbacteria bacterium CG10_big_fil_rev_8_21_14_0_10_51_16]|uniref:Uncharacterized protein n=1 Tax=Candidatus Vogelbacteria bacterium CG10_big_fil_rev_8_21_14_0_10_51_16 TaxID=1975045 RepID=A0A2H0RDS8_9BACT|nr:MAG: hypothetical protein COV10_04035 [Candidatus Vogelbacteria bacterium CG10_big_fil_rev_8_21_14_0_10_51_16]